MRAMSSQVRSMLEDNRKLIILALCLGLAWWVWKNCACENPIPDLKKRLAAGL